MLLTTAQANTLKAFILADATLNQIPHTTDGAYAIADALKVDASPDFFVWKTTTSISDIQDAVTWANFTPANPSAGAGQDFANWALACQGKQFNLQLLLGGSGFGGAISTGKANIRAGLQDCTSSIPSDVNGAIKSGGWANIKAVIQRKANILEKIFATGTGTTANPASLVVEGSLTYAEVLSIMGW